jgi:transcriptional regulator with XRE-family HTH domain
MYPHIEFADMMLNPARVPAAAIGIAFTRTSPSDGQLRGDAAHAGGGEWGVLMATNLGPLVKRLRERYRMTQQDLVEYTGLDRSASYISSIETGRTSPTLAELEAIARVFRTTAIEMIQEAGGAPGETRSGAPGGGSDGPQQRVVALFGSLGEAGQDLALELLDLLAERERRRGSS